MRKKYIAMILALLAMCICVVPVSGAMGTVRISLPEGMDGTEISCQDGEEEYGAFVKDGVAVLENLAPGDYKIRIPNTKEYEFQEVEVRVPTWSEEEQRMSYDITLEPKYQKVKKSPKTGDDTSALLYIVGGLGALSIGMGCIAVSYKKQKKC